MVEVRRGYVPKVPIVSRSENHEHALMEMEWLVTDITAVGSPDRAERDISWVILAVLANSGRPLCDAGIPF